MVFIDIWTLLSWLICKKYYIMLKKWRNKIALYMWYRIPSAKLSSFYPSSLCFPLLICFMWNIIYSISSNIYIYILVPLSHLPILYYIPSSTLPPINPLSMHPTSYCHLYQILFNPVSVSTCHHSSHFPILQSIPLAIISQTISRHNTYHHTTYPYHLT